MSKPLARFAVGLTGMNLLSFIIHHPESHLNPADLMEFMRGVILFLAGCVLFEYSVEKD